MRVEVGSIQTDAVVGIYWIIWLDDLEADKDSRFGTSMTLYHGDVGVMS
jgi:hypothetical protein